MEGKLPTGSIPEAQPNIAEAVSPVVSPEISQPVEALPAIEPRVGERLPPPVAQLNSETSPNSPFVSTVPPAELPILSADSIATFSRDDLNDILDLRFNSEAKD